MHFFLEFHHKKFFAHDLTALESLYCPVTDIHVKREDKLAIVTCCEDWEIGRGEREREFNSTQLQTRETQSCDDDVNKKWDEMKRDEGRERKKERKKKNRYKWKWNWIRIKWKSHDAAHRPPNIDFNSQAYLKFFSVQIGQRDQLKGRCEFWRIQLSGSKN